MTDDDRWVSTPQRGNEIDAVLEATYRNDGIDAVLKEPPEPKPRRPRAERARIWTRLARDLPFMFAIMCASAWTSKVFFGVGDDDNLTWPILTTVLLVAAITFAWIVHAWVLPRVWLSDQS